VNNGVSRGPIVIRGSNIVPLTDITLSDFSMWTVNQNRILNQCKNVYGTGYCAATSTAAALAAFSTTVTTTSPPAGFTSPTSPAWGVAGYGITIPIPVYTPAVFWSPISGGVASGSSAAIASVVKTLSSTSVPASTTVAVSKSASSAMLESLASLPVAIVASTESTPSSSLVSALKSSSSAPAKSKPTQSSTSLVGSKSTSFSTTPRPVAVSSSTSSTISAPSSMSTSSGIPGTLGEYYQCGGLGWTGSGTCVSGTTCVAQNDWYSQCLASTSHRC
jgi:rhamnogalacturonan hydrolase